MLGRLSTLLEEALYFSSSIRRFQSIVHQILFFHEKEIFNSFINSQKNKSIIAINASYHYYLEHIKLLWDEMQTNTNLLGYIVAPVKLPPRKHKTTMYNFYRDKYGIEYNKNFFAYPWINAENTDLILDFALSGYATHLKVPRVMYTHGMAGLNFSKDYKHILGVQNHRAIFLNGPAHKRAVLTAHKQYGGKLPELMEIGFLRGDRLLELQKKFDKNIYRKKENLDNNAPIVLFAPTWGSFSALEGWFERVVQLGVDEGYNLMLRLHPLTTSGIKGKRWEQRIQHITSQHSNIQHVVSADLDELMLASDVLITDVSGMALEYMTLDKPVVFLPAEQYFELYGNERPEKWIRPGGDVTDYDDLKQKTRLALKQRTAGINIDELVYNRGKALTAMIDAIETIIHQQK